MTSAQELYFRLPITAQTLVINAYAAVRYRKRYGRDAERLKAEVRSARAASAAGLAAMIEQRLASMLAHACRSVPFYRDRIRQGGAGDARQRLTELPILSKSVVREAQDALRAQGGKRYWTTETSGSTGTPLRVDLDQYAYRLSMALVAVHEEDHGVGSSDRRATFAGRLVQPVEQWSPPFWRYNWVERQMLFSTYHMSDDTLPDYLQALESFAPAELIGYPSAISTVAEFIQRHGSVGHTPRVVVTNSESLLSWQRELIEKAFRCRVADYYGAAESVAFASQCSAGRYHPDPLIGMAEILDEDGMPVSEGQAGRLVATTLSNAAMPLLRYDTGDVVEIAVGPCPCGRTGTTWAAILGRQDDVVVTPSGRKVGRLDHVFKGVSGVKECQIAHTSPDTLVLRVVTDPDYGAEAEAILVANTRGRVGPEMRVRVEPVTKIPRTNRGKFRAVVKEFP